MAEQHEGVSLGINVNLSQLEKANRATGALYKALGKVDKKASGLHMPSGMPREINHISTVTASYIQRLESEGKTYKANQERVKAYKSAVNDLASKQRGLEGQLSKIASTSGKASNAYRNQQIRINQTATEMNKFKSSIASTNAEMRRQNPTFIDHVKNKLTSLNSQARETHRTFKDVFMGSALGNAAVNALSNVGSQLKSVYKDGMQANAAAGKINSRFKNMGESGRAIRLLNKQIKSLKYNTAMSGEQVADLQTHMLNWSTIGRKGAMQMTKAVAGIGDRSKLTGEQTERLGQGLMRVGATGKVTYSSLNRVVRNAPAFYSQLAKGAGMSESKMKALLRSGKVTSKQFQQWMANSAKYSDSAFRDYGKTGGAALHRMQQRWLGIKKIMMKPLFSARNSGLQELDKILASKEIKNGARDIGRGINGIVTAAYRHRKDISGVTKDVVHIGVELGKSLWKDASAIINDIGRSFGLVHGNASKSGGALHTLRLGMDKLSKNQGAIRAISKAIIAIAAVKGLSRVSNGLLNIGMSGYNSYRRIRALRDGIKGIDTIDKLDKPEQAFKSLGVSINGVISRVKVLSKTGGTLGGLGAKIWGAAGTALVAGGQAVKGIRDRHNADERSKDIGGAVGAAAAGAATSFIPVVGPLLAPIGAEIGKYAGRWGGEAVNKFTKGWQRNKPPKKFWSLENLGWSTKNTFDKIGKGFGKAIKGAGPFVKKNGKELALAAVHPWTGIPALLYKTNPRIRKWANGVGKDIHNGWNKGIKASHNFFKNLPRNMSKMGQKLHKTWSNTWKKINSNRYVKAFKRGRLIKTAFSDIQKRGRQFGKKFGEDWSGTWRRVNSNRYVKAFKRGKFFSTALHDISSRWDDFSKRFGEKWNRFWGGLGDKAKGLLNNVKAFGNDIMYAFGGSKHTFKYDKIKKHASGGFMSSTHGALVGEAGPELAYRVNGSNARLLGANGPELTKVHAGEHILNARDTQKVMSGGLGRGLTLAGYAKGNTSLGTKKSEKSLEKFSKNSDKTWKAISRNTSQQTSKTRKKTVKDYTNMQRGVHKQMTRVKSGTISLAKSTAKGYGNALYRMKGYSRTAMKGTVSEINHGIRGIDKVLSQFGGNAAVIKPVKFATGTDASGRLTSNTLAMVNDAKAGPRQEAIVTENNDLIIPSGHDRVMPLKKGWGVLNGTQTQDVARSRGLTHFAKGSGMSHSALRKFARNAVKNPAGDFNNSYSSNLKGHQPDIQVGTTALARNASNHFGIPWDKAMWTVINDAIGDGAGKGGTREAFLKYAEKEFSGVRYVMGAASKAASDCSGMVMQALRHFGIDIGRTTVAMQHSSGVQYLGKSLSRTLPGDLVIYGHGTGAAGHVGIIKNPRTHTMFNETPPRARVTSIDGPKSMGYGYYRVKGLHNAVAKHKDSADKRLMALAKRELGPAAIKWIKKNLGDSFGSLANFSMKGDIGSRARALAAGLKKLDPRATKNGIAAILGNWLFESGLNPGAVNPGGGASGLGQWLGGRLSSLRAYARRHGMSWRSPAAQLSFAVKGDGANTPIFRQILEGHGSVASLANQFSARWERGGYNGQHVAGAMKVRKYLGYKNGGDTKPGDTFAVGEDGPELIHLKQPAHVYSNDESKKLSIDSMFSKRNTKKPRNSGQAPTINININGNISSERDANKYAQIIEEKIEEVFNSIGDDWGGDPSLY